MYFIQREGSFIDVAGQSFRQFMAGNLRDVLPYEPTMGDFADHITTVFTDVRLKRFLEMRGADAGSPAMMLAQSALWVGLLYDDAALTAAEALVRRYPIERFMDLRRDVPRTAMATRWGTGTLRDLARDVLSISRDGLRARSLSLVSADEGQYLDVLDDIASGNPTQSEFWLAQFHGAWRKSPTFLFDAASI
jgi:glutamate--cysteine ligase